MYISYEGKLEKNIYVIEKTYEDGSFSIVGCCSDINEADYICHMKNKANPVHRYTYLTFDLIGIIEEWYATNIVKD